MISIIVWFTVQLTHCTSQQDTLKCVSIFWLYTCFFLHNHNFCQQWFISQILKILRFLSDCLSHVFLFCLKTCFFAVRAVSLIHKCIFAQKTLFSTYKNTKAHTNFLKQYKLKQACIFSSLSWFISLARYSKLN